MHGSAIQHWRSPGHRLLWSRRTVHCRAESYLVKTCEFVDIEVLPVINDYWERAEFPWAADREWTHSVFLATESKVTACPRWTTIMRVAKKL